MGLLSGAFSGTPDLVRYDERPEYRAEHCLNRIQRRYSCTVCTDNCPKDVFHLNPKQALSWSHCVNCGLCVSTCPSRCFTPSAGTRRVFSEGLPPERPVSFSCRSEEQLADKTVICLAGVPWEYFAALALGNGLILLTGSCESCKHEKFRELWKENLRHLRDFLGEKLWEERVRFQLPETAAKEGEEKALSRRDIFAGAKKTLQKGIYQSVAWRLPELGADEADGLIYRRQLAMMLESRRSQEGGKERFGLELPRFTAACYGCGICEKICPQKALEFGERTEQGERPVYLTPWKCTSCGQCVRACPWGGLSKLQLIGVPTMNRLLLVRVRSGKCQSCGTAIPATQEFCSVCAAKRKRQH